MDQCAHEACTCRASEGEFCGDWCRESAGQDVTGCRCGHQGCAGEEGLEAEAG